MTSAASARVGWDVRGLITFVTGTPVMSVDAVSLASRRDIALCGMVKSGADDTLQGPACKPRWKGPVSRLSGPTGVRGIHFNFHRRERNMFPAFPVVFAIFESRSPPPRRDDRLLHLLDASPHIGHSLSPFIPA